MTCTPWSVHNHYHKTFFGKDCLTHTSFITVMKSAMAFFLFFSIVLLVYFSANYYVFWRGWQAIPPGSGWRPLFGMGFWFLASTYIAGRILERAYISTFSDVLIWTGSFWLGALLYLFLLVLFFDLLRLVNHYVPFFPGFVTGNATKVRLIAFAGSVVLVMLALTAGYINARHPVVRQFDVGIEKKHNGKHTSIRAVLLSDIHLGTLIGNGHLRRITERVMMLEPDIVFLAGDILDEDLEPVIRQNSGKVLGKLQAPLGVYGVMGNHEHIGGSADAFRYLEEHGIQMIRDSVVMVDQSFWLVGRDDRDKRRFSGRDRKSLESLMATTDKRYPVILLDHQPFDLDKAAALGVDLQLSGHTHHGQLWPLNYITQAIYTISHGPGNINGMHVYVSNGVGTWGPPVRTGNRPEIVLLNIRFGQ